MIPRLFSLSSKKQLTRAVYFNCNGNATDTYRSLFQAIKKYNISPSVLKKIIKIFDNNIQSLSMVDEQHYRLTYQNNIMELSDSEFMYMLSSGTTKGLLLYIYVVAALENGFDLLIDEVENHFHKTLVENMISLFKDRTVNKYCATYCTLSRQIVSACLILPKLVYSEIDFFTDAERHLLLAYPKIIKAAFSRDIRLNVAGTQCEIALTE